jgi:hypothetical protein
MLVRATLKHAVVKSSTWEITISAMSSTTSLVRIWLLDCEGWPLTRVVAGFY